MGNMNWNKKTWWRVIAWTKYNEVPSIFIGKTQWSTKDLHRKPISSTMSIKLIHRITKLLQALWHVHNTIHNVSSLVRNMTSLLNNNFMHCDYLGTNTIHNRYVGIDDTMDHLWYTLFRNVEESFPTPT